MQIPPDADTATNQPHRSVLILQLIERPIKQQVQNQPQLPKTYQSQCLSSTSVPLYRCELKSHIPIQPSPNASEMKTQRDGHSTLATRPRNNKGKTERRNGGRGAREGYLMAAVGCRRSRVRGLAVGMGTGECTRLASAGPRESRRRAWLARVGGMGNTPSIHGNGERHAAVPSTGRQGR
jgi:hypothetical protein